MHFSALTLTFAIALASSLVLTRVVRALATRLNVIDCPDGKRKLHEKPTPLWGGVAVYVSLALALLIAGRMPAIASTTFEHFSTALLTSGGLIFLLGFVDDSCDLRGRLKLALQVGSVLPIVAAGYWCDEIYILGHPITLGYAGIPLTVLWLVGCTNAFNLLDGMDGSASVAGFVAALSAAAVSQAHEQLHPLPVAAALCGALAGFFWYNKPRATIYLGDSGSTVIGLAVGLLCLEGGSTSMGQMSVAAPLVLMTIPLWDTSLAIVRRKLTGRRFDMADRGHLHHRLLDLGFNTWQALGIIAALSAIAGAGAIGAAWTGQGVIGWGTSLGLVLLLAWRRWFGHHEAALFKLKGAKICGSLAAGLWRSTGSTPQVRAGRLPQMRFEDAWQMLVRELGMWQADRLELRLRVAGQLRAAHVWAEPATQSQEPYHWRLSMSFGSAEATHCELYVEGHDALETEPWYLPRVAGLLRAFGRYWTANPDQVPRQRTPVPEPNLLKIPARRFRKAA